MSRVESAALAVNEAMNMTMRKTRNILEARVII